MATVVDDKIKTLRGIQGEMEELFQTKQASLSQFNENTLVKSELDMLEGDQVYKLVGPLLYPMDTPEAVENVGKRLEFIEREVAVAEKKIEEKNASAQALAKEIQVMQGEMRADAAKAAAEIAANAAATA